MLPEYQGCGAAYEAKDGRSAREFPEVPVGQGKQPSRTPIRRKRQFRSNSSSGDGGDQGARAPVCVIPGTQNATTRQYGLQSAPPLSAPVEVSQVPGGALFGTSQITYTRSNEALASIAESQSLSGPAFEPPASPYSATPAGKHRPTHPSSPLRQAKSIDKLAGTSLPPASVSPSGQIPRAQRQPHRTTRLPNNAMPTVHEDVTYARKDSLSAPPPIGAAINGEHPVSPLMMVDVLTPRAATQAAAAFETMIRPDAAPNPTPTGASVAPGLFSPVTPQSAISTDSPREEHQATPPPIQFRRKASKFFGVDECDVEKAAAERPRTPWFLKSEYTSLDLMYNMEGTVSSGTLKALVDQLTPHDSTAESMFTRTFLTCFRLFCKPTEFVHLLFMRYALKPPSNLTDDEHKMWIEKKLIPVRLRVFNVVKLWLEAYWVQPTDDECLRDLKRFAAGPVMHMSPQLAKRMLVTIKKKLRPISKTPRRGSPRALQTSAPVMDDTQSFHQVLPGFANPPAGLQGKMFTFVEIDPIDMASQLTLMEWDFFAKLEAPELLGQEFSKKEDSSAVNVKAMIAFTRHVSSIREQ
ncbi:ras guanine nucleotide exchange factor domain-containing protein [Thamnocephalis sphaerospora]|uniref:Ras guanine nucleotide exchange factor domain-containing protein n=1 Tax=Thamnocephalis sphaerospora TaxID=78915 RepID=A0A4P9XFT3_9FUNG|nr:ras guanine nucleotide exchange factor domain-containing protein [Thamnocephalis sphaerospora]|eukprot:RKP04475.1 ras guanine nucleotide exchange factor domain-containing protein [Thamnocephalis sphaerospora]